MSPSPPLGPPSLKSPQTQSSLGCYKSIIYSSAVAMQNGRKMLQSCRKHTQTHIHLPMGGSRSSSPLNLHWRLTLVWTRRGCLQEAHRPEPDVSLPPSPSLPSLPHSLTPSFAFHTTVGDRLLLTKTHTHTKTHISLSESHLGLEPSLYPPHKFAHQLCSRDLEQCRKTCVSKWIWIWRWCSFT